MAAQLLLDLLVLDVAHAEAQPQPILGLVAGEARIGVELLAVVAQELQLDALLDLPGLAGIDHLQHHAAVDLDDAAVGAGDRELHVVGRAMRRQDDVLLLLRQLLLLGVGDPYPQAQQQKGADGGEGGRDLDAGTAKTKRVQRTMAGG